MSEKEVRSLEELQMGVLALYESTIEECYVGPRKEDEQSWEEIEGRIRGVVRAIVGSRNIEQKGKLGPNDLVFETDLHGDLVAFLNTVLSTGLVKFNEDNPLGIVFYDPLTDQEYDLHTFEKQVAILDKNKRIELMRRIQLLPDVAPTEDFGKYINCGDIIDRGQQSEQLLYLIRRLCGRYSKRYPQNSAPTIIIGNHEGLLIPNNDNSLYAAITNGANHIFSSIKYIYGYCCDSDIKKQNCALKLKNMGMAVRTAIDSGEFTLARRIGKTIFTHAVITVEMIENLSWYFNTLAEALENASGWDSRGDQALKKEIQVLAGNLGDLATYPEDLSEKEIDNLVNTLNKFNVVRAKLIERRERTVGVEGETNPLLPGEDGIVGIMDQGKGDGITWLRKKYMLHFKPLPGVKFVLGHDPDPEEHRKWNPGMISYIDSYVSSGYNEGTTRANYFVADRSIFDSEGPFSEKRAPHIVSEDITPAMLEERARDTVELMRLTPEDRRKEMERRREEIVRREEEKRKEERIREERRKEERIREEERRREEEEKRKKEIIARHDSEFQKRWLLGGPQLIEKKTNVCCTYRGTLDITDMPYFLSRVGVEEIGGEKINRIGEFLGFPAEFSRDARVIVTGEFLWDFSEEEAEPVSIQKGKIEVDYSFTNGVAPPTLTYSGSFDGRALEKGRLCSNISSVPNYYDGPFKNNKPEGDGELCVQLPNSNYLYEGPCRDGRKNGKGRITRLGSPQYSYECEFINGIETPHSKTSCVVPATRNRRLELTQAGEDIDNLNNTVGGKDREGNGYQK